MPIDPIVDEIRQIRDKLAAKFSYDVTAIARDARARQKASKRKVVTLKPRKSKRPDQAPQPTVASSKKGQLRVVRFLFAERRTKSVASSVED